MKTKLLLFAACITLALTEPTSAQKLKVDSIQINTKGSSVELSFQLDVPKGTIKQNYDLFYTPVLLQDSTELPFPAIAFSGSRKQLSNTRKTVMGSLNSNKLPIIAGHEGLMLYVGNSTYQRWLSKHNSTLAIDIKKDGYRGSVNLGRVILNDSVLLQHPWPIWTPPLAIPDTTDYTGKDLLYARASAYSNDGRYSEAIQMIDSLTKKEVRAAALVGIWRMALDSNLRTSLFPKIGLTADNERYKLTLASTALIPIKAWDSVSVKLLFPVKDSTLNYPMKQQLDQIITTIAQIQNVSEFPHISIIGAASPEGFESLNQKLAWGRATAVKNYILEQLHQKKINYPLNLITTQSTGSDWEGLYKLVDSSDMPYRNEVLELLTNTPEQERGRALWALKWGVPYTYLYKHTFPKLRGATTISIIPGRAADRIGETINQAIQLIDAGKYTEAKNMLLQCSDDERAVFPLAIASAMSGNFEMLSLVTNLMPE